MRDFSSNPPKKMCDEMAISSHICPCVRTAVRLTFILCDFSSCCVTSVRYVVHLCDFSSILVICVI